MVGIPTYLSYNFTKKGTITYLSLIFLRFSTYLQKRTQNAARRAGAVTRSTPASFKRVLALCPNARRPPNTKAPSSTSGKRTTPKQARLT